jgi:tyrosinase
MQLTGLFVAALGLCSAATAQISARESEDAELLMQSLNTEAYDLLKDQLEGNAESPAKRGPNCPRSCNVLNARVRRDWAALSVPQRKDYIKAVQCLQKLPSKSDPTWAPGARSRYDDFLAIHIHLTTSIHSTGNFLTWHRYYVWAYEEALINECGYKGVQPYWNWFANTDNVYASPLYDGKDGSFGGDGEFFAHNGSLAATGNVHFPSGKGGGCVKSGPFKDYVVNMGPIRPGMQGLPVSEAGPLGFNPHCLRRDLTQDALSYMTATNLFNITLGQASHSIKLFQDELQGRFGDKFAGMHSAGHYVAGGDASDVFASPSDPTFFLHHAQVDRMYWIWQVLHARQANDIAGTMTIGNNPPSRNATIEDLLDIGVNAPAIPIKDTLNTLSGPFCYVYL